MSLFPHPTVRRAVPLPPRPVRPSPVVRRRDPQRVARAVLRGAVFYLLTASLIVAGVAVHEYSHYAAHEGLGVPPLAYAGSVGEAQRDLLETERAHSPAGEVLVQQPKATTIVFFPNTFLQAAVLGLLPSEAYQDNGVLASTFFHLDGGQVDGVRSRGGEMPDGVIAAPLWVAIATFSVAFLWTAVRPNLFSKALLVAGAVNLGDAGHHAAALGIPPDAFYALTALAIVAAAVLLGVRTVIPPKRRAKKVKPDFRPATRIVLSVRPATDKPSTRRAGKPGMVPPPVTA